MSARYIFCCVMNFQRLPRARVRRCRRRAAAVGALIASLARTKTIETRAWWTSRGRTDGVVWVTERNDPSSPISATVSRAWRLSLSVAKCPWCRNGCNVAVVKFAATVYGRRRRCPTREGVASVLCFLLAAESRGNTCPGTWSHDELERCASGF